MKMQENLESLLKDARRSKKCWSDIKNGLEIDYILVYKLSRFGRNAADILNSLEFVQSYGINLICIEEGIDSSQTSGKLLISVLSAVAEIERENIIEQDNERTQGKKHDRVVGMAALPHMGII